jgi:hypothetical protein
MTFNNDSKVETIRKVMCDIPQLDEDIHEVENRVDERLKMKVRSSSPFSFRKKKQTGDLKTAKELKEIDSKLQKGLRGLKIEK